MSSKGDSAPAGVLPPAGSAAKRFRLKGAPTKTRRGTTYLGKVTASKEVSQVADESTLKCFLAGGVGGAAEVIVGHPLDLVKVRVQVSKDRRHASVFGSLNKIVKQEGAAGLFRGVSAPLAVVTPLAAVTFWSYEIGQRGIRQYKSFSSHQNELTCLDHCLAGAFSAFPTTALAAPSERLKVLMQVDPKRYDSLFKSAQDVYANGGIRSLYRGTTLTLLREIPGSIAYFGVYEYATRTMMSLRSPSMAENPIAKSTPIILTAGGLAGVGYCLAMLPADVLKSRQQAAPTAMSIPAVFRDVVGKRGWSGLFQGLRPALIRSFPANAACFYGMEMSKDALSFLDE